MKICTTLVFLLFCYWGHSQDSLISPKIEFQSLASYEFPKSYGVSTGVSFPIHFLSHKMSFSHNTYPYKKQYLLAESGFLRYPYNSTEFTVLAGLQFRKYKNQTFYTEWMFSSGLLRTFYDGIVYEVQSGGNIKEMPLYGRNYAITGVSYSMNWNLNVKMKNPLYLQLRPFYFIQYPFNSYIKMHFLLSCGIRYGLTGHKTKSIQ